jgi:CheY-like chemotaxis protein
VRILFADDSVTAQSMGKRILTEAGYEVVAVSNGAAAVKKIAEQKPDIIILDLYMPGYSGLEVCEKVRGSMATLKTPVLLTVGKMEPYRPEDANRVRADGVIVKPFEASDLLAIVKKFEERLAPPPLVEPTVVIPEEALVEPELPVEAPEPARSVASQSMVDVPDHMASSSAFSDLLGTDAFDSAAAVAVQRVAPEAAAPELPRKPSVPEYELPVSWRQEEIIEKTEIELPAAAASSPEPFQASVTVPDVEPASTAPPPPPRPLQIPTYQEPAESPSTHEMLPTAAPAIGEIEIPRDPFLEESAAEATRHTVADSLESGLIPTLQQEPPAASAAAAEPAPVDSQFHPQSAGLVSAPAEAAAAKAAEADSDADFEARVAAAMAAYNHNEAAVPEAGDEYSAVPSVEETPASSPSVDVEPAPQSAREPEQFIPVFEYHPPVSGAVQHQIAEEPQAEPAVEAAPSHPEPEWHPPIAAAPPALSQALPSNQHHEAHSGVDAASEALASAVAAGSGADRDTIAQAVHRVIERLKPELVEEILRELKSKQ